jgi:hypothetical protein
MNPFEQMSKALMGRKLEQAFSQRAPESRPPSRVGAIRELLKREAREMGAAEIAFDVDLPSFNQNLVWLLLKYDIAQGRVLLKDGMYSWNAEFESAEQAAIRAAIKLLKKNGYTVTKGPA